MPKMPNYWESVDMPLVYRKEENTEAWLRGILQGDKDGVQLKKQKMDRKRQREERQVKWLVKVQ